MRVWDCPDLAVLRLQYLFPLAHLCHVTAPRDLTLTEFAVYLKGIDEYEQELRSRATSG